MLFLVNAKLHVWIQIYLVNSKLTTCTNDFVISHFSFGGMGTEKLMHLMLEEHSLNWESIYMRFFSVHGKFFWKSQ